MRRREHVVWALGEKKTTKCCSSIYHSTHARKIVIDYCKIIQVILTFLVTNLKMTLTVTGSPDLLCS